jgi:hypothetical protein
MRILILSAILLLATPSAAAEAKPIVDPSTGVKFDAIATVAGTKFRCLGAGVRKVFLFKAYAVTYCLEEGKVDDAIVGFLQKNHAGQKGEVLADSLEGDQRFFDQLARAPGDKLVVMALVRDISKEKIAGAFRDSLSEVLPPAKVEKLIDTIPGDAKNGERILLYSRGDSLVIDIAGNAKTIDDAQIASQLWRVWLGPDAVAPSLKESIAQQVAARVGS